MSLKANWSHFIHSRSHVVSTAHNGISTTASMFLQLDSISLVNKFTRWMIESFDLISELVFNHIMVKPRACFLMLLPEIDSSTDHKL